MNAIKKIIILVSLIIFSGLSSAHISMKDEIFHNHSLINFYEIIFYILVLFSLFLVVYLYNKRKNN